MQLAELDLDSIYVIGCDVRVALVTLDKVNRLEGDLIEPCKPGNMKRGWLLYVTFAERGEDTPERHAELIAKAAEYRADMPTALVESADGRFRLGLVRPMYIKAQYGAWAAKQEADAARRIEREREWAEQLKAEAAEEARLRVLHAQVFSPDATEPVLESTLDELGVMRDTAYLNIPVPDSEHLLVEETAWDGRKYLRARYDIGLSRYLKGYVTYLLRFGFGRTAEIHAPTSRDLHAATRDGDGWVVPVSASYIVHSGKAAAAIREAYFSPRPAPADAA